jgi:hypothetical protein
VTAQTIVSQLGCVLLPFGHCAKPFLPLSPRVLDSADMCPEPVLANRCVFIAQLRREVLLSTRRPAWARLNCSWEGATRYENASTLFAPCFNLMLKIIILPRQARNEHSLGNALKTETRFCIATPPLAAAAGLRRSVRKRSFPSSLYSAIIYYEHFTKTSSGQTY